MIFVIKSQPTVYAVVGSIHPPLICLQHVLAHLAHHQEVQYNKIGSTEGLRTFIYSFIHPLHSVSPFLGNSNYRI
jgi:hypothetical protein